MKENKCVMMAVCTSYKKYKRCKHSEVNEFNHCGFMSRDDSDTFWVCDSEDARQEAAKKFIEENEGD